MVQVTSGAAEIDPAFRQLRNNTHRNWWQDAGLRKLSLGLLVGYGSVINSGYDSALFNGLLTMPLFLEALQNPNANKLGIISAAYTLGGVPGYFPSPWVADKYGRRACVALGAFLLILGALLQTFLKGPWKMLAGRLVAGFGSAFQGIGGGPYVIEIAHPRYRPQAAGLITTCYYIGSIVAAWVTFGTLNIPNDWCWKAPCLIQVFPCLIQLAVMPFTPESPRWLVANGRHEEAHEMLKKYHANGAEDDELVEFQFAEIRAAIEKEQEGEKVTLMTFTKTPGNRYRLMLLIMVGFYSQWVGNGIISYYLAEILESVGITNPTQQAGFNGGLQIWNWFMAIGGALVCEKVGRRPLWLTSALGMLASYVVITACSAVYAGGGHDGAGKAVLAFLFIYFGFYDIAFTALTTAYPLEILPFSMRTKGLAICQFFAICAAFFNIYVNPIALQAIAWKYYFVFMAVLVAASLSIFFCYPETKGRTLEEIAVIFDGESADLHIDAEAVHQQMTENQLMEEKAEGAKAVEAHSEYA